jgi:hypothetical protein
MMTRLDDSRVKYVPRLLYAYDKSRVVDPSTTHKLTGLLGIRYNSKVRLGLGRLATKTGN